MQSSFVYSIIRRSNYFRLTLSLLGLVIVITGAVLARRYLYNFLYGPFNPDHSEILATSDASALTQYYVTVTGDEVYDTGYQYVNQYDDGHEEVDSYYPVLLLNDRLLLVETSEDNMVTAYTGALVPMSQDIQTHVISELEHDYPEIQGAFLPFMLETDNFYTTGLIGLGIGAVVVVLSLWGLWGALSRMSDPAKHPIMRALSRHGDVDAVMHEIESELTLGGEAVGDAKLTRNWLVVATNRSLKVTRLKDVTWLYKHITQHRTNGIPTGKTFAALIWDRHGASINIGGNEKVVNATLDMVAQRAPWAIAGYSKEIEKTWKSQREAFIAEVERRRNRR